MVLFPLDEPYCLLTKIEVVGEDTVLAQLRPLTASKKRMGIKGLSPHLRPKRRLTSLKDFASGYPTAPSITVDVSVILRKMTNAHVVTSFHQRPCVPITGAIVELELWVETFRLNGCEPILVFDGMDHPLKNATAKNV